MLRRDVVEACADGKFAIYPMTSIDEGIALLTGLAAGERASDGAYPIGSVNRLIEDRLAIIREHPKEFWPAAGGGSFRTIDHGAAAGIQTDRLGAGEHQA